MRALSAIRLRTLATLVAALVLLSAFAISPVGASAASKSSPIPLLRVGWDSSVSTLDLTKTINASGLDDLGLETLMRFTASGKVKPDLATSVQQTSPTTYVYNLRHGVKFWDGHELTAADVVYSWNYERSSSSQVAFHFASVKTVTATGRYTVEVTLLHPDASWQYVPATNNTLVFEAAYAEAHQGTFGDPRVLVMGSGPWEITSLDPTSGATLKANPNWWGGQVPIKKITVTFYASDTSEALAFRSGALDFSPSIGPPKSFAATSGAKLLITPTCSNGFFQMNTSVAPWNNVDVRRAVAYALNRKAIIAAYGGYASPLDTLIPTSQLLTIASKSQIASLYKQIPLYPYSVKNAKHELAQSPYPHGFSTTLTEIGGESNETNAEEVVSSELAQVGIKVTIKQLPVTAWQAVESGPGKQRSTSLSGGGCFSPDPSAYSDFLGSWNMSQGNWNVAQYDPLEVDTLLDQGVATSNAKQRFAIYSKLLDKLQTDEPYVGLWVEDATAAMSPKYTIPGYSYWPDVQGTLGAMLSIRRTASS